jgi:uncharacterized PurR-regulated membrane protein YhhQ (DUF165 family)
LGDIFGLTVPAAVIIFSVSYILGGVLTEVYGYRSWVSYCLIRS